MGCILVAGVAAGREGTEDGASGLCGGASVGSPGTAGMSGEAAGGAGFEPGTWGDAEGAAAGREVPSRAAGGAALSGVSVPAVRVR